ncbi:metallophosphoesterase [Nonlabens ponticola]|uniref:Phosphoesterase n=1 Tax=Nonlabens ponticola TaxID=2496866 RepID=A0A3S9MYT5_9FLAO|nr:metallophosphoesterase [Nonlabens ponticola]AZQ44262.1 phosphoesterase [Nonlabens ponticola]
MNKNPLIFLIAVFIISSCASYKAQYKEGEESFKPSINDDDIVKSFYLIGDVGKSPIGGKSDGLLALEAYMKGKDTKNDHLIFLGDNIYPTGMPKKDTEFRPIAENHLDAQIAVAKQFEGKTIFIPGNHDYYDENLDNVEREKKYIEEALDNKDVWSPKVGCPIDSREISKDIQLIIVDSQWYLAKWDEIPTINDNCDQIKTREQFFLEIESELKKNQGKTILITTHHPIFTNGIHGGQYAAIKHLYPTQNNIPIPVLGSLTSLIRTSGGVSAQDKQNKRYQSYADRMTSLIVASGAPRVMLASGHEHTLQYIVNEGVRQIVSGSGAKKSYVALSDDGLFAYGGKGFAKMDVLKDGSSTVTYYGFENGTYKSLYSKNAIDAPPVFDMSSLPDSIPAFAKANIYNDDRTDKSKFYEGFWGEKYRELYNTDINAHVALLDTLKGGLSVVRPGGGHQTRSLRLVDKDGKEYNLRALKKSAVQFLQTTVFKDKNVADGFDDTTAEDLLFDFYTAAHPYGALVIPTLADAVGVYHTNPEIYYVPKQDALGNYNTEYGDELYMLVERPEENHKELESFGKPDNIESTADVIEKLRRDEKYSIDQDAYVRARMFDMLIGDWDRHQDQWRWSEFDNEDGTTIFKPIPRDRDQVFSNFDGAVFATLRTLVGITNQFATYGDDLDNVKWFNTAATYLDRSLGQEATRETWLAQARYIQDNLSDEEIDIAFKELPPAIYPHKSTKIIIESMKARRDNLVDIASRYYDVLARLAIITGTDKDDYVIVDRIEAGKTKVSIYRNKDGEIADLVRERVYDKKYTDEIWVYALDDDDIIKTTGNARNPIKVRIIGGQNNDIYKLETGKAISVYDHKTKDNTFEELAGARLRKSDNYDVNLYNPRKNIQSNNVLTPAIGFNPDDGIRVGLQNVYTVNGFNRNPNTRVHKLTAGYYFATDGYQIAYEGEFAGVFRGFNLLVKGRYTGPTFAVNFFGFGNETPNFDDDLGFDFNRVRLSRIEGGLGGVYRGEYGSILQVGTTIQGIEVERDADRFIADFPAMENEEEFFERSWFSDVNITYRYSSYDNPINPTRGMKFVFDNGITADVQDFDDVFYYIKPQLGFHNALTRDRKLVLKTLAQAHVIVGDDFEFYQSAQLGQNTGLRGYRTQRFSGESAFATSADVRYSFDQFKTGLIPLQMGVFLGGDVGRVWLDGQRSKRWNNDYGGGIFINSAEAIGATFNLFTGDDGLRFSFQVGFNF